MKKIITIVLLSVIMSTMVAVSVAAIANDSNKVASKDVRNNTSDLNVDDIIPADIEINKHVEEVPVKVLNASTKDDYFKKALNSVDYYNIVNGTIETNMLNGYDYSIEYNVDMSKCKAYQHVLGENFDEEVFVQDSKIYTVDNIDKTRNYRPEIAFAKSDELLFNDEYSDITLGDLSFEDRITYTSQDEICSSGKEAFSSNKEMSKDGTMLPVYHYRLNPTNTHYASSVSLFAQEMVFGFLSNKDLWEVKDKTEYLGRKCTTIEGVAEKNYGAKLNIDRFVMIIDDESGIILNFEGYDSDDNLTQYSKTTHVSFHEEKIKAFKLSDYKKYSTE